jgi:hypothetical protein
LEACQFRTAEVDKDQPISFFATLETTIASRIDPLAALRAD